MTPFDLATRALSPLALLLTLGSLGAAQSSMEGQVLGVAWPRRSQLDESERAVLVRVVAGRNGERPVVDLGEWDKGTAQKARLEGVHLAIRFTELKAKNVKTKSEVFGKSDGTGSSRRMKFTPAESVLEIELLDFSQGGERVSRLNMTRRSRMPGQAAFAPNEFKKVIKSDPDEYLVTIAGGMLDIAANRADGLWLWNHRRELIQDFPQADRSERLAFWERFHSSLFLNAGDGQWNHYTSGGPFWPQPRWTLLELLRIDTQLLLQGWASIPNEPGIPTPCGWCAEDCFQSPCKHSQHLAKLLEIVARVSADAKRVQVERGIGGADSARDMLGFIEKVGRTDLDRWRKRLGGRHYLGGRPSWTPKTPSFVVFGGATALARLSGLDRDLMETAISRGCFVLDDSSERKRWKLPPTGPFLAVVKRRNGTKAKKDKVRDLQRGDPDLKEFERLLLELMQEELNPK